MACGVKKPENAMYSLSLCASLVKRIWLVENADSDDKYLALFNIGDQADIVETQLVMIGDAAAYDVRDLWSKTDLGIIDGNWSQGLAPHAAKLYRLRPVS